MDGVHDISPPDAAAGPKPLTSPLQQQPLAIETEPETQLNYWQGNLRSLLDRANREVAIWIEQQGGSYSASDVSLVGPPPPQLSATPENPSFAPARPFCWIRLVEPEQLTPELIGSALAESPKRLYLLQRTKTGLDRIARVISRPAAADLALALRTIHLHSPYALQQQLQFRRRGVQLQLAEFAPVEAREAHS